jgi:threonine synthase
VFCEPASAAGLAGLKKAIAAGLVPADASCVCVLTGNGLKDPDNALRGAAAFDEVDARPGALDDILRG